MFRHSRQFFYTALALLVFATSCSLPKRTIYFRDNAPTDTTVLITKIPPYIQSVIASDDILAFKISSISDFTVKDPVSIFNDGGIEYPLIASRGSAGGGGGGSASGNMKGYLVDPDGYVDFPVIGKMKVAGLSLRNVKDILAEKLRMNYVKDPVVEIRILNYKVTVLGEVHYPGVVIAPNHRINVMEALAAADDISLAGRRDNILVIRENHGRREFARINLNSRNAFANPYFYLKQNDIIYVEAARVARQKAQNDVTEFYLPAITQIFTAVIGVFAFTQLTK
jgi:polysaccharide export outer membrane protein